MNRRQTLAGVAAAVVLGLPSVAISQEVTLRLHQFLPPYAPVPAMILRPWAQSIEEASGGRIQIQHFDAMSLGGRPAELIDQARDGVVDLTMTLVGYTPGRFPRSEVFELPFMMTSPVATAAAFWELVETDLQMNEFADVQIIGAWNHGPGMIHSNTPIERLEDMRGLSLRGPTRIINDLLAELGAEPVGMPLPAIPESLSRGVVSATVLPWEVTTSIRLAELVNNHTEFASQESLYTAMIILAMNKDRYESLPDDLRAIIDERSGAALSTMAAQVMWDMDAPAREAAVALNNNIITLDDAEIDRWKEAAAPVYDRWVADMAAQGIDGAALIERARALIAQHGG